jgi:putative salt-induced outer membrane protein
MAAAQTPAPAPPPGPPPPHEGSAEFAFIGTSGNSSTQTIGAGGEFIYRPNPWETKVKLNYVRNEADDEVTAQSFLLLLRAQRPIRPRLAGYGQYGYQRDRFAGIINRNAFETGLMYTLVDQAMQKLTVDGGLGYAHESRVTGRDLSTSILGTGASYLLKISDTTEVTEDGHLVYSLSDGSDWRYANIAALSVKMTTLLSLKLSNTVRYVHAPAEGFKNTDVLTSIAVVAKF